MADKTDFTATARAYSNIAFIKYWGNSDHDLRIPVNPSLSMNLNGLYTETSVTWSQADTQHALNLNGDEIFSGAAFGRVAHYLDAMKSRYDVDRYAQVVSHNTFPTGAGIASSASAFAALALAASAAAKLDLSEAELSAMARYGSGSASRSIPGGFVEWHVGDSHETSVAQSIAPPDHWNLVDVIAIVSEEHKSVGSTQGHRLADTSSLQSARVEGSFKRFDECRDALLNRDFERFAEVVELDSNIMHAVMMTSNPPLFYWQPESVRIMQAVKRWRQEGVEVCYTLDAGPNVHCLCLSEYADIVHDRLKGISGIKQVLTATPGGTAHIIAP